MDHHCDADGNAIQSTADAPDKSEKMNSSSITAKQTDKTVEVARQKFGTLVSQISAVLENVKHRIEILPEEMILIYKRVGKAGKHSIIHYDVIVNSNCRVCDKIFPTPFQARMLCCETKKLIPWPVSYKGRREAGVNRFPSLEDLVEYYEFAPGKDMLVYHCPFLGCQWTANGSPDNRHVSEQHMIFDAKDKKQPVLCTIGDCGLYMKRPEEKMREHRASIHRLQLDTWDKPMQLPALTPVILAALAPDTFYEAGLQYYVEEYESMASKGEVEEETKTEAPVPKPSSKCRKTSKNEAEKKQTSASRASSRARSIPRKYRSKATTKENVDSNEKPCKSKRKCKKNENKIKTSEETVVASTDDNPLRINFKMDDGMEDTESSSCEGYSDFENIFELSSVSSGSSDGSFYCWCDEDEENFRVDSRSLPCLKIPPKEPKDCNGSRDGGSPRRRRSGNLENAPDLDQFRDFYNWTSGPMI